MPYFISVISSTAIDPQNPNNLLINARLPWILVVHPEDPVTEWTPIWIRMQGQFFLAMLGPIYAQSDHMTVYRLYHDHQYLPHLVIALVNNFIYLPNTPTLISSIYFGIMDYSTL
jgi:hypothetical protein